MEKLLQIINITSPRYSTIFLLMFVEILLQKYQKEKYFLIHILEGVISFFINPVQESEIEKLINNLNKNKSVGPCSIPIKILQSHVDTLKQPWTYLINVSFQQGIFPEALKSARVTTILKKEDIQCPSNYRHISVLSIFSKLYEKCMYYRLYAFLTKYKLLFFKKQFGFRSNYSISHALISLNDLINKYSDHDYFVFIDLQKAFDTVHHEILFTVSVHWLIVG